VLEAKSRSGGRAFTDATSLSRPFDLGCHWLHSASVNPLRKLAAAGGSKQDGPQARTKARKKR